MGEVVVSLSSCITAAFIAENGDVTYPVIIPEILCELFNSGVSSTAYLHAKSQLTRY